MFIVFEGCDGSGKTTHSIDLKNRLAKYLYTPPILIRFSDRETQTGKLINNYLSRKQKTLTPRASHLLFSANRWEKAEDISKCLKNHNWVMNLR